MSKKFVITNGDYYISKKLGTMTKDLDNASIYNDLDKAQKVYKSSISKAFKRLGFQIKSINENEVNIQSPVLNVNNNSNNKINSSYTKVDIDELKENINSLSDKLTTLKGNKDWLIDMESEVDKEISDIMHFIEFYSFSASEGYKLCKAIKDLRLRRRKIKNELQLIDIVNVHTLNNVALGQTNKAITGLDNKKYAPRVLQELFNHNDIDSIIAGFSADIDD